MDTQIDHVGNTDQQASSTIEQIQPDKKAIQSGQSPNPTRQHPSLHISQAMLIDVGLTLAISLIALIPRIQLAQQLDLVTDEIVYIVGGKTYLPLLRHFNIVAAGWSYNYEHPPLVKLLIGLSILLNKYSGFPFSELFAARIPSILLGTALVVCVYVFGRVPFGRVIALGAALCLAVSPWLCYFSGLAYLDMTMTALVSIAFLLLWHALRHPRLYLLVAVLMGMAAASKYPAVLVIPGMALFTVLFFIAIRPRMPATERPPVPWLWWFAAIVLAPLVFLLCDPAIWSNPIPLLLHSFDFEMHHSENGHLTFLAGQHFLHVPQWTILYMIIVKMSAFVIIPSAFFVLFALLQLARFYLPRSSVTSDEATRLLFLLTWLLSSLGMFSLLNIAVGTHYFLPLAAPVALAGAYGLAMLLFYRRGSLFLTRRGAMNARPYGGGPFAHSHINPRAALTIVALLVLLTLPHLIGLSTVNAAEGYTSEFFNGENTTLQVAYPGYREGVQWLAAHTDKTARVGLIALVGTLNQGIDNVSWYAYNRNLITRFTLIEAHPNDTNFPYNFLIWPMHLVQRGYAIPEPWRSHIVHIIMGGKTIYCYVLARSAGLVSP